MTLDDLSKIISENPCKEDKKRVKEWKEKDENRLRFGLYCTLSYSEELEILEESHMLEFEEAKKDNPNLIFDDFYANRINNCKNLEEHPQVKYEERIQMYRSILKKMCTKSTQT